MSNLIRIGVKRVTIFYIPVVEAPNENDWEFVFINAGDGKKQMAVF